MLLTCNSIMLELHQCYNILSKKKLFYPKQKQHEGLDGNGSPDNATKETMAADQNPRVQVVIAER